MSLGWQERPCRKDLLPQSLNELFAPVFLKQTATLARLQECFAEIKDPRVERTRLHQLSDIIIIAILSVIAGGNGWEDMETYGLSKQAWLSTFLALPNGIRAC